MQTDNQPLRLRIARKDVARELQAALKIGQAIRGQRIRDMRDLDEARREKQEWVGRSMELLPRLVTGDEWAEQFNDFIPTILPEYAEFGMFVDVFEEEMRHRLGRLQGFLKNLPNVPEPGPLQPDPNATRAPHPEIADVLDRALEAQPDAAFVDQGAPAGSGDAAQVEADDEPQLETIYEPPEETMAQQQQQQQLQQQQPQQTVAASILLDPEPPARTNAAPAAAAAPAPTPALAGANSRGALIVRADDQAAAQGIAQFLERLGLTLRVIDRRNPNGRSIMDELATQSGSRFVLMLTDSNGAAGTPDDLFDLGCCVGRMGPDRVFALHRGGDGAPDRFGISHVPIDETEGWQLQLARLLKKAGVSVDLNKLV